MFATIEFTDTEMQYVREFCREDKRNYDMLIEGLKPHTFYINLQNPCVFWISQEYGMTGVNLFELRQFIRSREKGANNEQYQRVETIGNSQMR